MMKRSGKFYRKNEAEVMKQLGLEPTPNSGSGWIVKEDGISDDVICQLKSTDASSIKINLLDIHKLLHNAAVEHKMPVFAVQFLQSNEVFLLIRPQDLEDASKYLETGKIDKSHFSVELDEGYEETNMAVTKNYIKSDASAREVFRRSYEARYKKERKSAL